MLGWAAMGRIAWMPALLGCWLWACAAQDDSAPKTCAPGATLACDCPDGSRALTVCTPDGEPDRCACAGTGDACEAPGSASSCDCPDDTRGSQLCLADRTLSSCRCPAAVVTGGAPAVDAGTGLPGLQLTQRCCHGIGSCYDESLLPPQDAELLGSGGCRPAAQRVCVPDAYADPTGFELQLCRSIAGAEGRCIPDCNDDPALAVMPRDLCDPQHRCAPCYDPFTGEDSGFCTLSNDRGPREPALVFDRCCTATGTCVPASLLPEQQAELLGTDSCEAADLCLPDALLDPAGPLLLSCRGTAELEGRCLPACLPLVAASGELLSQGDCEDTEACVPCFDPLSGSATGVCSLSPGDEPAEPPAPFPRCCDIGGSPEGYCIPVDALPEQAAASLPQESCPDAAQRCVLQTSIEDPLAPLPTCSTLLGNEGRCLRECLVQPGLAGLLSQRDCVANDLCVPCSIFGTPTGVCESP